MMVKRSRSLKSLLSLYRVTKALNQSFQFSSWKAIFRRNFCCAASGNLSSWEIMTTMASESDFRYLLRGGHRRRVALFCCCVAQTTSSVSCVIFGVVQLKKVISNTQKRFCVFPSHLRIKRWLCSRQDLRQGIVARSQILCLSLLCSSSHSHCWVYVHDAGIRCGIFVDVVQQLTMH